MFGFILTYDLIYMVSQVLLITERDRFRNDRFPQLNAAGLKLYLGGLRVARGECFGFAP